MTGGRASSCAEAENDRLAKIVENVTKIAEMYRIQTPYLYFREGSFFWQRKSNEALVIFWIAFPVIQTASPATGHTGQMQQSGWPPVMKLPGTPVLFTVPDAKTQREAPMIRHACLATLLLVGLSACAATADPPAPVAYRAISVTETPCFGFCPAYTITVTPDDRYVLEARSHTRTQGRTTGALDTGSFARMTAVLEREDAAGLPVSVSRTDEDTCPLWHTDAPGYELSITRMDGRQDVSWYRGCSGHPAIERLERISEALRAQYDYDTLIAAER